MTDEIRLGKYLLYEQLGRGGYGTVYRAQDTVLNVERAVKVLHPALAADLEFIGRFRREAQLAARLEHPHIVPVYDLGEEKGSVFLAMKYLPGGSLKDLLAKEGRLPFDRALEITAQVARALEFAHSQPERLVHRDVKPGNILFEKDGTARLADFGFAKALQGAGSASISASGGMIGTPAYMAPEIWLGQEATPQTDQYSLACMIYEMLTGQSLFGSGDSPPPLVMKRHFDPLVLPVAWPPGVPPGITMVLEKALAKEPAERYPAMDGFVAAMQALRTAPQPVDRRPVAPRSRREKLETQQPPAAVLEEKPRREKNLPPGSKKRSRLPWGLGIGGVLLLIVCLVAAILFLPDLLNPLVTSIPGLTEPPATTEVPVLDIGSTSVREADEMVMVYVPEGNYSMGMDAGASLVICQRFLTYCQRGWFTDEEPEHTVFLDSYWIDQTEVTNGMYARCVAAGDCQPPVDYSSSTRSDYYSNLEYGNFPVIHVTWNDARAYCGWAEARLPSEAEWEKAARGTNAYVYPWGNNDPTCTLANLDPNGNNACVGDTSAVDAHPAGASPYGALDLSGNVWEWVADWYAETYYSQLSASNPSGPDYGDYRVLRGGSWGSYESRVRATYRNWYEPSDSYSYLGFRCSRGTSP